MSIIPLIWLCMASGYGLLYGAFSLGRGRIAPGLAMCILALCPLGLGIIWLLGHLFSGQM